MTRPNWTLSVFGNAAVAAVAIGATGCLGQGKYTSEAEEEAREKHAILRAGTDHDLALQQFHSGDLERALGSVENSIALNGKVSTSHLLHGRVLNELGRSRDALAAFDRGLEIAPEEAEFHYCRGTVFEQLGELDSALIEYQAATLLVVTAPEYRLALAEVLVELGRSKEAKTLLAGDTGDFAANAGFRQALGHIALLEGDVDTALVAFTEAVVLSPSDPVLLDDLCRVQLAAGELAQAEASLARLTGWEGYEDRTDLRRLHATCLLQLNRPVEARSVLMELTRSGENAHDMEAWRGLVDVALMMHDDRLLRAASDRLLARAPDRYEGYLALAAWQRKNGDLEGALRSVHEAVLRAGDAQSPGKLETLIQYQIEDEAAAE